MPFAFVLFSLTTRLSEINDQLLLAINGLAGRSWFLDNFVSLTQNNDLAKAGVIGCCFLAAWYGSKDASASLRNRRILIATLVAAVFVLATTKGLSHTIFLPRPDVQTQKIYHLEGDTLVELKRLPVRIPSDETSQKDYRDLLSGDVQTNDLGSFPSDHAGFFIVISLGILLASRRLGLLALCWTVFVILAGKMIDGQHTPLDIMAGATVAVAELAVIQYAARRWFGWLLDKVTQSSLRYTALSSAIVFAVVFEVSSTLTHVRAFIGLLAAVRKHVLFGI
jgi:membrane-associated phospholipid phosphatase